MENKFETIKGLEQKERLSRVILHFFRHAEPERDPNKTNQEFELTERGRQQAINKSKEIGRVNIDQAVVFGSPRLRSLQTAGFAMAGESLEDITGDESFEELKDKIDGERRYGSKLAIDPRLDFYLDKNTPFGQEMSEAVFVGHNLMRFMVEKSDKLAVKTNDQEASTYSRHARDIAEIIKKYTRVGGNWNKLVESGKYEDPDYVRFLGTHGGPGESFLLKVVEKIKGVEERNRLLDLIPHQFDYTEGFDATIINVGSNQIIHILFKKGDFTFDEDIPITVIDQIIEEGDLK